LKESAEMSYPGFCAKYGANKMTACAYAFGTVAGAGVEVLQGYSAVQSHFGSAAFFGFMGGVYGLAAATTAHHFTDKYCAERNMDVTRGGKLVKSVQVASYATILGAAIGLSQLGLSDLKEQNVEDKSEAIYHENNRQSQSLEQTANHHGLTLVA
jgi:hypothetical protein